MRFAENVHRNPLLKLTQLLVLSTLDSGVWPESESFRDLGFGPPPKKWKGACNGGKNFTCNNKLIGARYYNSQSLASSARDDDGHGSHSASTAAGNYVKNASFYGIAEGTARGGVPSARIAAYKVCDKATGCRTINILAAVDDAIADGVDAISVSLGGIAPLALEDDVVAIGSFHALQKGILVVQSAGNTGGTKEVLSVMPWIFTVAASNTDRRIATKVALGHRGEWL